MSADDLPVRLAAPVLGEPEREAVADVLDGGRLADGPVVREFEAEFAALCETDHAVATANGTAALTAALRAVGVGADDTVLTTPFSFVATANAVRLCGASVEFVDVDPETYNLDAEALASRVSADPDAYDAVVAVHLYGLPADAPRIREVCDRHDLSFVEDAAQAHAARVDGEPVGSFGDAATFSFYPTKNVTTGEGGMIVTDREDVADAAARFVNHGRDEAGYEHVEVGHNLRMTSVAAAIGRVQLDRLPGFTDARRDNAARLDEALANAPVATPTEPADRLHVYHQYTVRHPDRDRLAEALDARGVQTGVYYPKPIHEQPAYDDHDAEAPVSERLAGEVLSLPVHPSLTDLELERVADAVREATAEVAS